MKIKTIVTEIECTANELRQSNTLSDAFYNMFRGCFNNMTSDYEDEDVDERADDESESGEV